MIDFPEVCICIPCYNNEETISATLQSVIDQDYPNITIKVFDNASTDTSRKIVRKFFDQGRKITLYVRDKTVSGEDNFNTCIENAEGIYSGIFHSDDIYTESIVSEQVRFLQTHLNCGAVSTHAVVINENNEVIRERFVPYEIRKLSSIEMTKDDLLELSFKYGNFITCPSVLFRTDILTKKINNFRGDLFKTSADLDVWLRVAEFSTFGFINKPLIRYRSSLASFSFNLSRVRTNDHDLFLVLNYYLASMDAGNTAYKRLLSKKNFLLMKDRAKTNINRILLEKGDFNEMKVFSNLKFMFTSRFHFKYLWISFILKILISTPFILNFSSLAKKIRF